MILVRFFLLLSLVVVFSFQAAGQELSRQIIVKFKPGVVEYVAKGGRFTACGTKIKSASIKGLAEKPNVRKFRPLYAKALEEHPEKVSALDKNKYVIALDTVTEAAQALIDFQNDPNVENAKIDSLVQAFTTTPNDPYFLSGDQYALLNISASRAWDRTTGETSTLVAVLDSGINYNHPDLQGRIELTDGWDFVNNDADPWDDFYEFHGTMCSGIIAAATNNGIGMAGVNWHAKILPLKVLDNRGYGYMSDIIQALDYAREHGAQVINMSFGQYSSDRDLAAACLAAYQAGIVLVAAAGNGNVDWPTYPAYLPTVMTVAAVDSQDKRSAWSAVDPTTGRIQASNYGSWVDVCAPGTGIWSTSSGASYASSSGTSFAAPFVSGVASLVIANEPFLTNQQIMDKIASEADDINSLNPGFEGLLGKRVNAYLAVSGIKIGIISPPEGAIVSGNLTVVGTAAGWDFSHYVLAALTQEVVAATLATGTSTIENGALGLWNTRGVYGDYTLCLTVFANGLASEEARTNVFVDNVSPEAVISSPESVAIVSGKVTVRGTALDQTFDRYRLEFGAGVAPTSFQAIKLKPLPSSSSDAYLPVTNGVLGTWETAGLNGLYTLRLVVYDKAGNQNNTLVYLDLNNPAPVSQAVEAQEDFPMVFATPNPFVKSQSAETKFLFTLSSNFNTTIYLFDLAGNLIWQRFCAAGTNGGSQGENTPPWNGKDLFGAAVPNGVYIYQVVSGGRVLARGKIVVLN
ncbi:hypothetical protein COT42_04075 [Candidatus Saganbacteria bacterium CG08_land_8_20_14_0_20_45_16]|uniref:Peptidase S8/S53 domain-containing protein n=1 Tax=Candidatus Saganbacteria bacterium CG08_land_8_20_14_0_20_45_16 TaxID=2014293 RepID=A0A2H0XY45_UNCSA|nr:MAG: hypothetical protein COT42_04075 [Candidatus Saganbacteria bacterium CG08_land_8_20_14_0_20_45_16]